MELQDSGHREQYPSGGQRERAEGKGRYDLIPPEAIDALAKVLEAGAKKYGDRNWEKGLPLSTFIDSGLRHFFKLVAGEEDEDHAALAFTNLAMFITTRQRENARLEEEQERAESSMPLITEGPFTGWRQAGYTTEGQAFEPDGLEGLSLSGSLGSRMMRTWQDGDSANVDELAERHRAQGWISDNRCGTANPHEAHPYGRSSSGAVLHDSQGGQWCDGYVTPDHRAKVQADVEAIKRIADAQLRTRTVEPNWSGRSGG